MYVKSTVCIMAVTCLLSGCLPSAQKRTVASAGPKARPVPVLCLFSEDLRSQGLDSIDPKVLAFFSAHGFELHTGCYQTTAADTMARYPVVVGMMPMLHAGTRAIGGAFGTNLECYVRSGGSFVLIPAPSYYGGEDFVRQLNPWLRQFGAELLNEQPRDPANQRLLTRVIGYRYLATTNFTPHDITRGLESLWLPLDYTDAYILTHTMTVSPEWQVVVRGNPTCATYPLRELSEGRKTPGTYASAPPFLAVRSWGKGRIALFTTSSQYFIFDAYHWAFGDGFVMKNGGERLMTNLFTWLAESAGVGSGESETTLPGASSSSVTPGNVMICDDKGEWFRMVRDHFAPSGSRPFAYVDCGAMSDVPYSRERGQGYLDTQSWPIRWVWSELFHPTAANVRAFRTTPVTYRFDHLDVSSTYQLGILRWAYEPSASRPLQVKAGAYVVAESLPVPRFADRQGPVFSLLNIPAQAISSQGTLEVSFAMVAGAGEGYSSVAEIWLFESSVDPSPGKYAHLLAASTVPRGIAGQEPRTRWHAYRGLIGARSTLSGGTASVAEMGKAAREAGYDFLAFTEDAARLDASSLAGLKQACEAASDTRFRCLPGICFSSAQPDERRHPNQPATWGSVKAYVIQNIATLPSSGDYESPYDLFWSFLGGARSCGRSAVPTLLTPRSNGISPFYQRFWRGFDVFTLSERGDASEDARALYVDLVASGYGPYPRASGTFLVPEAIRQAADKGWAVTFFADSLSRVEPYHYTSCVGNGPRFLDYRYTFDHSIGGLPGEGLLFRDEAWIMLHADIEAPVAIKRVTLYSGRTPLRIWYPNRNRVRLEEPIWVARNHELWVRAECVDGTEALSGRYCVEDRRFMLAMCGDNQNTICSLGMSPRSFVRDERDLYLSHSYWHTGEAAGQLGAMRRMSDIVPRVIETGIVQPVKRFNPCPVLFMADGATEDHGCSELRIQEASSDYNQIEYRFDTPASRARSRVLLTTFRPEPSGDTTVLIETVLQAKTNVIFRSTDPGLRQVNIATLRDLMPSWNYSYKAASSRLVSGAFNYTSPGWRVADKLAPDGGVMLWPSDVGSLLVFPLDGVSPDVELRVQPSWVGREQVQLFTRQERLAAGQSVSNRFLVVLHQGTVGTGKALDEIRAGYVRLARHIQSLSAARLVDDAYALTLEAENEGMRVSLDTTGRIDPLPVALRGVNPCWPCGVVAGAELRLREAATGTLRFVVPPQREAADYFAGNLVLSDHKELRIEWGGMDEDDVVLHLHNPAPREISARVRTHPALRLPVSLDAIIRIPAGASIWVRGHDGVIKPADGIVVDNNGVEP